MNNYYTIVAYDKAGRAAELPLLEATQLYTAVAMILS